MRLLLLMSVISSLEALHCDREFNFIDSVYEKGYDIICQGLTNKYISLLQDISITNEISLKIENCTLTDVTSQLFKNVADIKHLYLENSTFSFPQTEAIFQTVSKLEELTIINTRFKVTKSSLSKLKNLRELNLNKNQIKGVETGSFRDLKQLSVLQITQNMLSDLNDLPLCDLKNLKTLNFSRNQIVNLGEAFYCEITDTVPVFDINDIKRQSIPTRDFIIPSVSSTELYQIDLSFNSIVDLSKSFAFLKSLKLINLQGNKLKRIDSNYFTYLEYLEELQVSNNIISIVDDNVFENKYYLEKIDMSNNRITNLNFEYLGSVKYLNLYNNSIALEYIKSINETNKLNKLLLGNNQIREITTNVFKKLTFLETLDLSGNNVLLSDESFNGLTNLKYLYISNNNIKNIPKYLFKYQKNLRVLDLSQNKLNQINNNETFHNLKNLEILNLSRNSLINLNYDLLQPLDSLETLDISHNDLHYVDYDAIMSHLPSLTFLNIKFNNLSCELLTKIIAYLKKKGVTYTIQDMIASDKVNVGGIYCNDDLVVGDNVKPEKHVLFNIILVLIIFLVIVILGIIIFKAYIYLKRRKYRADEFELIEE